MRLAILASLLGGCANVYDLRNRAPFTAYDCDANADGTWDDHTVFNYPQVSQACVDAILEDFKVDDTFGHVDLTDPSDFDSWGTAEGTLVGGAWALLHYDWQIDHVALNGSLADVRLELGDKPDGWNLYNWSAAQFKSTTVRHGEDYLAAYNVQRDQLRLDDPVPPLAAAAMLVHEGKHGEGAPHYRCKDGTKECDRDWTGAYGASAGITEAIVSEDEYINAYVHSELLYIESHINPE